MKVSGSRTAARGKSGHQPGNPGEGELFVLFIDRTKMIKQLLDIVNEQGLVLETKD
jgi:hypothetical protein